MRILSFVLMPNHWHFLLWPEGDHDLSNFCRWLTHTHSMRWHAHYHTSGTGHIYQGRFKSFAVETDDHLYTVLPVILSVIRCAPTSCNEPKTGAGPVSGGGSTAMTALARFSVPGRWRCRQTGSNTSTPHKPKGNLKLLRRSLLRSCPFGSTSWQKRTANRQGLSHTLRPLGRPKKSRPWSNLPHLSENKLRPLFFS